ncbi:aspartyl protease family protein [Hyphomonas sp.]|uniref:aspartyl protease family protein n=1 Tax=Hyphomonas sp. TaxID=87 RepID=UPI00391C58AA
MIRSLMVLAVAAMALAGCAHPPAPAVGVVIPAPSANLRVDGGRLYVPLDIQGFRTEALLDSGAEMTMVDAAYAAAIGLGLEGGDVARGTGAGTEPVRFASGVTLRAPGRVLEGRTVAVMDLTDVSRRLIGRPLTVILGRDYFDAGRVRLDIGAGILEPVSDGERARGVRLPLSEAHGIMQVPAALNGREVLADFDLGNGSDILVSEGFAEAAGLLAPEKVLGVIEGGGIGGPVQRRLVRVDSLSIAGETFHNLTAAVNPGTDGAELNVGVSVLRHFRMVIDFPGGEVWLEAKR